MKLRNLQKGWALLLALVLTVSFAGPSYAVKSGDDGGGGDTPQHVSVDICHATGAEGKWTSNTVDDDSILNQEHEPVGNGHAVHQDGRDIIPAFTTTDGFKYPGKNLGPIGDTTGQAILANGCKIPDPPKHEVVPQLPVIVDECGTENDSYTLPSNTESIEYSYNKGYVYAKITAANTVWGDAPSGWTSASKGKLKFKIELSDESCQSEAPDDKIDMTMVDNAQIECGTDSVATKTTTTTTPYKWDEHAGQQGGWVLDAENATEDVTYGTRELTQEERFDCAPDDITRWVLWTIPYPGCVSANALNMGFDNASNTKGWSNCNTANKAFPQTHPQVMTEAELKAFVPACGTWYQADMYTGTPEDIADVLDGPNGGTLTITNGVVEDHNVVVKWFYLKGAKCVTPVEPTVIDKCGTASDEYKFDNTGDVVYSLSTDDNGDTYVIATLKHPNSAAWKLPLSDGWSGGDNATLMKILPAFDTSDCTQDVCWLVKDGANPYDYANHSDLFPQIRVDCDSVIPCGQYVQKDTYRSETAADIKAIEELGDTLTYGDTGPEDSSLYKSHIFIDGPTCVTPIPPTVIDKCGTASDEYKFDNTGDVVYSLSTDDNGDTYVIATLTHSSSSAWKLPLSDGWTNGDNGTLMMKLPAFDTSNCTQEVCWLVKDGANPYDYARHSDLFPQKRVNCDDVIPCGRYVQKDTYRAETAADIKAIKDLGRTLTYGDTGPEDSSLYLSHVFIDGENCAVVPVDPTVVDKCGTDNDKYKVATTPGVEYAIVTGTHRSYVTAKITASNTTWATELPSGWTNQEGTLWKKLPKFTNNDPCTETVCWIMPVKSAPGDHAIPAWFPQKRVDCDQPVPCGKWEQKDVYNTSTGDKRDAFEDLGRWLTWVHGQPEDHDIYMSHEFIYGGDCAKLQGDIVAACVEGYPVLNYDIQLIDPDHNATPSDTAYIRMRDGHGNFVVREVSFDPQGAGSFSATGSIPWPGTESGGWPGWELDADGVWQETDGNYAWTRDGTIFVRVSYNPFFLDGLQYPDEVSPCDPPDVPVCTDQRTMETVSAADFARGGYTKYDAATCDPTTFEICNDGGEDGMTWSPVSIFRDEINEESQFWDPELENGGCALPATLTGTFISPVCDGDVPYINYKIVIVDPDSQNSNTGNDATITFHSTVEGIDDYVLPIKIDGTRVLWPGASVDADGSPTGWPGWAGNDIDGWKSVGNDNFGWTRQKGGIQVTIQVNPTLNATVSYPPATPDCATDPTTEVDSVLGAPPLEAPSATAVVAEATFAG